MVVRKNRGMTFSIIHLTPEHTHLMPQVAQLLVECFAEHHPGSWDTLEEGIQEVQESFGEDRISRVAVGATGEALGWIGGISQYDGHVWELHPLCVRPDMQGKGIGTALVRDLEAQVKARGGLIVILGSDDETGQTSLSGIDLYPNVWEHIARIRNLNRHPYEFYQKMGYVITGVVPDANGPGKPDIIMSRRLL